MRKLVEVLGMPPPDIASRRGVDSVELLRDSTSALTSASDAWRTHRRSRREATRTRAPRTRRRRRVWWYGRVFAGPARGLRPTTSHKLGVNSQQGAGQRARRHLLEGTRRRATPSSSSPPSSACSTVATERLVHRPHALGLEHEQVGERDARRPAFAAG